MSFWLLIQVINKFLQLWWTRINLIRDIIYQIYLALYKFEFLHPSNSNELISPELLTTLLNKLFRFSEICISLERARSLNLTWSVLINYIQGLIMRHFWWKCHFCDSENCKSQMFLEHVTTIKYLKLDRKYIPRYSTQQ